MANPPRGKRFGDPDHVDPAEAASDGSWAHHRDRQLRELGVDPDALEAED